MGFKLVPQIDSAKLKSYTQWIANQIDIAPVPKKVNVENGVEKVAQEGQDGLAIDQDSMNRAITTAVSRQQSLTFSITSRPVAFRTVSTSFTILDYPKYLEVGL